MKIIDADKTKTIIKECVDLGADVEKYGVEQAVINLLDAQDEENVVEREKIDKAIEEVDRYLFEQEFGSDYRKDVKEIIKRNIGE